MSYNSKYKGAEVDALLDKAGTAVQPDKLATVATSGSYNDLSNKPTIPAEQVNADWNATSGKAQILNKPTIPDISGKVDKVSGKGLSTNDYTTTEKSKLAGIASGAEVNVQSDWNVTDSSSDAYIKNKPTIPSAVTADTVSGWGFIKSTAYSLSNHGTSSTTFTLTPNVLHVWGTVTRLTLTLGTEQSGVANEYLFQFTSGSTATTLSLPDTIKWQEDLAIEANKTYQVSILNGFATVLSFSN